MSLEPLSEIRNVKNLNFNEKQRIFDFLQGAVYCWCKNRPNEWFSMKDLMSEENSNWDQTPLVYLLNKHKRMWDDNNKIIDEASKDSGWLLKKVINDDNRLFQTKKIKLGKEIRQYKWSGK